MSDLLTSVPSIVKCTRVASDPKTSGNFHLLYYLKLRNFVVVISAKILDMKSNWR